MPSLRALLGLDGTQFHTELERAKTHAHDAGHEIGSSWGNLISEKLVGFASAGAVEEMTRHVVEYGEKVYDTAARLGMSTEAVQAWDYALKMNGSSMDQAAGFFEKLATARMKAQQGDEKAIDAFKRLGVAMDDLKNKRLEDVALQISEAFEAGDPQKLIADLRTVGGRGAGELAAAFKAGMRGLLDEAPVIDDETITKLKEIADDAKSIWMDLIKNIAPAITGLYDVVKTTLFGIATAFVATFNAAGVAWSDFKNLLSHPLEVLGSDGLLKAFKHVGGTFLETFKDAAEGDYDIEERKRKEREARKEAKKSMAGGAEYEDTKAEKEKERVAKEVLRLKEEAARVTRADNLAQMTAAERVQAITASITQLKKDISTAGDPLEKAKMELELAKQTEALHKAQAAEQKEEEREIKKQEAEAKKANRFHSADTNQLQKIGAYAAPRENSMERNAAKSAQHLAKIEAHLQSMDKNQSRTKW